MMVMTNRMNSLMLSLFVKDTRWLIAAHHFT